MTQEENSLSRGPIKSADADAVERLQAKLEKLEEMQALYKKINAAHIRFLKDPASLESSDLQENTKEMVRNYKPKYSWEPHPIAPYVLTNNNAEIRRCRARIEDVSKLQASPHAERAYSDGVVVVENPDVGRIQVQFPDKPDRGTLDLMKRSGFRWAPSEGVWQRHLNDAGRHAVESVMKQLGKRLEAPSQRAMEESTPQVKEVATQSAPTEVEQKVDVDRPPVTTQEGAISGPAKTPEDHSRTEPARVTFASAQDFTADRFTPTQWETAEEKVTFAHQFIRFVESDFARREITEALYGRLSLSFGHIAHYDQEAFYDTFSRTLRTRCGSCGKQPLFRALGTVLTPTPT
jgi:hypothetical protein